MGLPVGPRRGPSDFQNRQLGPSYSFKTSKSGILNFSGKCKGNVNRAVAGVNHIALLTNEPGAYDDCTMTLTDSSNNRSLPLKISSFVVAESS